MNPQLAALFTQHRTAILGTAAAGVAGLALLQRRKAAGTPAGAAAAAATPAGMLPAAAVVPASSTTGGSFDTSSYDTYNALQPTLEAILQQQNLQTNASSGITSTPAPVASTLFAPTASGTYALYGNGTVAEVESDGSQLGLGYQQWNDLLGKGAKISQTLGKAPDPSTAYYETAGNLAAVKKPVSSK